MVRERDISGPVSPDQGIVLDSRGDPTHPLRKGRIRIPTAVEVAKITDPVSGQPIIDQVVLCSVSSMDGRE